jgi:hypothetical protein
MRIFPVPFPFSHSTRRFLAHPPKLPARLSGPLMIILPGESLEMVSDDLLHRPARLFGVLLDEQEHRRQSLEKSWS